MTGPVGNLVSNLIASVSAGSELSTLVSTEQRTSLCRGLFDSYYKDLPAEQSLVFDTNRSWTANIAVINELFPNAKVLACVRNLSWVMDSLETQFQSNPFENTRFFGNAADRSTVFTRCDALLNRNGMVGYAWSALQEALYGPHADRFLIVDYDLLVRRPADVMGLIYDFIDEPAFDHDFDNVEYDAPEFDALLGASGLHKVRKKVEPKPRRTILPPDLFEKYSTLNFWRSLKGSKAKIIASQEQVEKQNQTKIEEQQQAEESNEALSA